MTDKRKPDERWPLCTPATQRLLGRMADMIKTFDGFQAMEPEAVAAGELIFIGMATSEFSMMFSASIQEAKERIESKNPEFKKLNEEQGL